MRRAALSGYDDRTRIQLEHVGQRPPGGGVELGTREELALPLRPPAVQPREREVRRLAFRLRGVRGRDGDDVELHGLRDPWADVEVVLERPIPVRDNLDDVPTIVET